MSDRARADELRALDLLADRATFGISHDDLVEMNNLLKSLPNFDADCLDRAAAVAALACCTSLGSVIEPMPDQLRSKIIASAARFVPVMSVPGGKDTKSASARSAKVPFEYPADEAAVSPARERSSSGLTENWFVVAASVLLSFGLMYVARNHPAATSNPKFAYASMLAGRKLPNRQIFHAPWKPTEHPAAKDESGDVVWCNVEQCGYMRFHKLAPNNPRVEQYQLWIFDVSQDEDYPIDGGVFDIDHAQRDPQTGDLIVRFVPKLRVVKPTMFVITVEKPGGVVVSSRKQLPLVAKVK